MRSIKRANRPGIGRIGEETAFILGGKSAAGKSAHKDQMVLCKSGGGRRPAFSGPLRDGKISPYRNMEYLSEKDYYEIRLAALISNEDEDVVLRLYQPLVGALGAALYLNLLSEKKAEEEGYVASIGDLMVRMQVSQGMLLEAKRSLEAVGLVKSYLKESPEGRYFIFELYAPKTPAAFFADVLFRGLLIQYVGEKKARRLANAYELAEAIPAEYREDSASFVDVYNPDYNDRSFASDVGGDLLGHRSGRVKTVFDYARFYEALKEVSQIDPKALGEKDMKELARLATLFGLEEAALARIVAAEYEPEEKRHLDYGALAEACKDALGFPRYPRRPGARSKLASKSELASKVRLMDEISPAKFLSILQNNTKPAGKDLDIINRLSENYGFSSGVINVIVDYVLYKSDNMLSYSFCESVAAQLAREGVKTTVDAMNYLNRLAKKRARRERKEAPAPAAPAAEKKAETAPEEKVSDEEMKEILRKLRKAGSKDGKDE